MKNNVIVAKCFASKSVPFSKSGFLHINSRGRKAEYRGF